jgi:hypothetical protein
MARALLEGACTSQSRTASLATTETPALRRHRRLISSLEKRMTTALIALALAPDDGTITHEVLSFQAPYLEARLVRLGVVRTPAEAAALFIEVKKYLLLAADESLPLPMTSAFVDAAWHHFILFTAEYAEFCRNVWGQFQHHRPADRRSMDPAEPVIYGDPRARLREAYERRFGPLPDVWYDERCLHPDSRLTRPDPQQTFSVELEPTRAVLVRDTSEVVCRTSSRARPALEFIARHPRFLLRELAGLASDDERVRLVAPLVEYGVLKLAV